VVAWPLTICGGELGAKAAAEPAACIIPPQTNEEQAKANAAEDAKLKAAFEGGQIADLNTLSVKQLQTLAKQNGWQGHSQICARRWSSLSISGIQGSTSLISSATYLPVRLAPIARTKADFIHLLDAAEPGVDHSSLAGAALDAKLKEHKIGLLRTKDDLIQLLAQKQASLKQAQQLADQLKKIPPSGGLHDLTVVELQEMAKAKGVSLNMTKQDAIDLLDELEPGVDHKALQGATLIDAKKKHHIGPLKNKQQLVKALEKAAGEELAEKAKKERKKTFNVRT